MSTPPAARVPGLDALRAGALLLGIVLHSLMPFLPSGGWVVMDAQRSDAAAAVISVIHLFRMVLFMTLAGYFGRMVLHRRGTRAWLRDRGLRILLPLVVFGPLALASIVAVAELDHAVRGTPLPELPPSAGGQLAGLLLSAPAHLWFLNVLVWCIVVTVLARALLHRVVDAGRVGAVLATPVAGVAVAALPYLASLLLQGDASGGIEQPTTILPEPVPLVGFLGAFVVGWCLQARPDALARLGRWWPLNLAAAGVLTIVGGHPVVVALAAWAWVFGLLGLCVHLRRQHAAVSYLAEASYWMYLLHLPLLLVVGIGVADQPWPIVTKLLVTWSVTGVLLLLSYDLVVRDTGLGRWLNGRRRASLLRTAWSGRPTRATTP